LTKKSKSLFGFDGFKGKRISFEGGVLTREIIEEAARKAVEHSGYYYEPGRLVSPDGKKMLKKIQEIEPEWDEWVFESQIWAKAKELNLL